MQGPPDELLPGLTAPWPPPPGWRELAYRRSNGLAVRLLWDSVQDCVWVEVADELDNVQFAFKPPRSCALKAYYDPFTMASQPDPGRLPQAS